MKWTACLLIALAACKGNNKNAPAPTDKPNPAVGADAAVAMVAVDAAPPDAVPAHPAPPDLIPGADPMYPTARKAGTADLFFLEDPVRGPHVTHVAKPSRSGLVMTKHANCQVTGTMLACSEAASASGDRTEVRVWRRRDDGKPVMAEWRIAGRVDASAIYTYDAAGALKQLARFDEVGDITNVRSYDPVGTRYTARNLDGSNALSGCGSYDLQLDAAGRVVGETCLQWLGEPMRDTNGVTTTKYVRDAAGFAIKEERFDPNGAPMAGVKDAVYRIDSERDAMGRISAERYYDVAGKPTPSAEERGCYGVGHDYENGQEVRKRCLGADGLPRRDTDGVATFQTDRDDKGCEVADRYLGARGEPVLRDGVSWHAYKVDRRCFKVEDSCHDRDGDLTSCGPGEPAWFKHKRDSHERIISSTFLNERGQPTADADYGVYEIRYQFDRLGREIGESCYDPGDAGVELVECSSTGFARTADTFDENGRISERRFFDVDNRPAANRGTIVRLYIYDNYDHLAETHNLDAHGELFEADGMAIKRNYYDDNHLLFGIALLDRNGKPAHYTACFTGVVCPDENDPVNDVPWHAVRIVRSPDGRATYNHYFDANGRKMLTLDCKTQQCWGVD